MRSLLLSLLMTCFATLNAQVLITTNSNWKYLDDGSDQGTAWTANGFNDAGWASGNAELGYGDGGEATIVDYGPDINNKYITTYVRQEFNVADAGVVTSLDIDILVDDGAVVYLNGVELFRRNMPTGAIDYLTDANVIVSGADESAYFSYDGLPTTALVTGTNVLAVEIHNRDGTSSDLGFNLSLEAIGGTPPPPPAGLIASGATWKYLDNGSDQGTAWSGNGFNDAAWASGNAELGYGDGDEATVVGYGGNATDKYPTTYFRHEFNVANAGAIPSLDIDLVVDDGAVVYLNGVELFRQGMAGGSVDYQTYANFTAGGADETAFTAHDGLSSAALVNGTNVIAVEVHQAAANSSDISFNLQMETGGAPPIPGQPVVTRGPYLQIATPTSILVKWRTDINSDAEVKYGTSPGNLNQSVVVGSSLSEHAITLSGLSPNTTYYYAIANGAGVYEGGTAGYRFTTAPNPGANQPVRMWALGDAGTANQDQRNVRDAYYNYVNGSGLHTDMILMLGDNAYNNGTDAQYQAAFFDIYPTMLQNTAVWSTRGNHDSYAGNNYYDIFNMPVSGQAGGEPSGTESYYSFDYGNIHVICLNSENENRSVGATMYNWCETDLMNTNADWIVVMFHHPPYTKGSHDSDSEGALIEMRQNFNPLFETHGVDLILSGHSHSYERSYLLKGHYGNSGSFNLGTHAVDPGSGNPSVDNSYAKTLTGPTAGDGAVYITAGSSGKVTGTLTHHPAMYEFLYQRGSVVVETQANEMRVRFLHESGSWNDEFIIEKAGMSNQAPVAANDNDATFQNVSVEVDVLANDNDPNGSLDASSVTITSAPTKGTITNINATTGAITYLPNPGESGVDIFEYTVCDDGNPSPVMCDAASVTINIQVNSAPVAVDDNAVTNENVAVAIYVVGNDTDAENNGDTSSVVITQAPASGNIVSVGGGYVNYQPANGITGLVTFKYRISDDLGLQSNEATVTVDVIGNVAPVAVDDSDNTTEGTAVLVFVAANDSDANGDLDVTSVTTSGLVQPSHGSTVIIPGVGIQYTPDPGYFGYDVFEYSICDQSQPSPLCDVALVTVFVNCDGASGVTADVISGTVFEDNNSDGINVNEAGAGGVTVSLYLDENSSGTVDGGDTFEGSTVTSGDGTYSFNVTPVYTTPGPTLTLDIVIDTDDAWQKNSGDMENDKSVHEMGKVDTWNGMRFQNAGLPFGAVITSARIDFVSDRDEDNTPAIVDFYGELSTSASTFNEVTNGISSRSRTSSSVNWNIPEWFQNQTHGSPDLTTVIQELVNQPGWTVNSPIAILAEGSGSERRKWIAWEENNDPVDAPHLVIDYEIPGGSQFDYVLEINTGTLPAGGTLTTDNVETASFTATGQEDCLNDIGFKACTQGNSCDDGDPCTINDVYDAQCGCAGTFKDTDGDGTCDANDGCPTDPNKTAAGDCGCGVADTDTDGDGTADCNDLCPTDPNKIAAGDCGCGVADTDTDGDGTADCNDGCPTDPNKIAAGDCGCGVADIDTDGDGTLDCFDGCPTDPNKIAAGDCGCGVADTDTDSDGTPDCNDGCPTDPNKTAAGDCGCGVADTDTDSDGTPDCNDGCPTDPNKIAVGDCGCGVADTDTDGDGTADCNDLCPTDPNKIATGDCGCGVADTDTDGDGTADCNDGCPTDPNKTDPGTCGCGISDGDSDGDGTIDCNDGCPFDPNKIAAGDCGCGVADTDTDGDGTADCNDGCPTDPNKTAAGDCGCGVADTDTDGDGTADCVDGCPTDPNKIAAGDCGCGVADTDTDGDGTADCIDGCPTDPNKTAAGDCGCGVADTDTDGDGTADCIDGCPADPNKIAAGDCGCGVADTDTDGDGTPDCNDGCPTDPNKTAPGTCGCGVSDGDTDGDGTIDCNDGCPLDPNKIAAGDCGCGVADTDTDGDGTADCNDGCPTDPNKTATGDCGCGVADTDTDGDGTADCVDACPTDPNKIAAGDCGCGVADTDTDGDGTADCNDGCVNDPNKTAPGDCGCGVADTDTDSDGTPDCNDGCPTDPNKVAPGTCGCGVSDADTDGDGTLDCNDGCPTDPNKIAAGDCGCGVADTDTDGDGTPDCNDGCVNDPNKTAPGDCGCGVADTDTDSDGTPDCNDGCVNDPNKTAPGDCGCGVADTDTDSDGTPDCNDGCANDPNKTSPGDCGCGVADTDSDGDSVPDCDDICPGGDDLVDVNMNMIPDACDINLDTTEVIFQINTEDNDAVEDDGDVKVDDNELKLGKDRDVAVRFVNATIPDGATIVSAYVEFTCAKSKTNTTSAVTIYGESNANAPAYVEVDYNITDRTNSSSSVSWEIEGWNEDETYASPDITGIVQELIDQPGWTSGKPLAFMFYPYGDQERKAYSYDKDPNKAARLVVKYVGGAAQRTVAPTGQMEDALFESIILYPNPTRDELNVTFGSKSDGKALIQVFDIMGKLRFDMTESVIKGSNTLQLNVGDLPSGNYFLRVVKDDKQQTMQFMVE